MIQDGFVKQLLELVNWKATMDTCCDREGSNKHAEKWCSPEDDCLKKDLTHERIFGNLPLKIAGKFI